MSFQIPTVKSLIENQLKKRGWDKYVKDITIYKDGDVVNTKYRVTVSNGNDDILVGFNVIEPYDDAVDVGLKLGSLR